MPDISLWTRLSIVCHPNLCNNGAADESRGNNQLFCNVLVEPKKMGETHGVNKNISKLYKRQAKTQTYLIH